MDGDAWSKRLDARLSDVFETPVRALWVPSGTAANCLALAALCRLMAASSATATRHIQNDECGAPEFYTHGAKLMLADGDGAKLTPSTIAAVLDAIPDDVHRVQPHAISITNATEYGRVYAPDEVAAIGDLATARGLGLHMDGARFANAVAHLGCSPADVTWRAGVDALSFGFVKNGGMNAEVLVFFKPEPADATLYRRKRAGLLLSKGRYLAAQILAMLEGDLWLDNARAANAGAALLAEAAGDRLIHPVEANEMFLRVTPDEAARLRGAASISTIGVRAKRVWWCRGTSARTRSARWRTRSWRCLDPPRHGEGDHAEHGGGAQQPAVRSRLAPLHHQPEEGWRSPLPVPGRIYDRGARLHPRVDPNPLRDRPR